MRAVVLVDESLFVPEDPNFTKQPRKTRWEAEFSVSHALRHLGHTVIGVPATPDVPHTIEQIKSAKPDFVFNLVEEINGNREYDSLVVRVLELMGIPCTGASADALMLSRNKHLAKLVVAGAGVPVPEGIVIGRDINVNGSLNRLKFPLIVKPARRDASEGINAKSYVKNPAALESRIQQLMRKYSQPVLCEEYVPGREIIITISGVKKISIDSICEIVFPRKSRLKFATEIAKFSQHYRTRTGIHYRTPPRLAEPLRRKIIELAKKAYCALEIQAYAKIEFRVSGDRVVFIEANPNSQLSRFAYSTDFAVIGYENFIKKIVRMALERPRQ